ncbi:MAG TPA: Crp/Fnr family transcriptional regulator [Mobilitalea sp.]|nr:Crp/Fnr family transcriptional regulator [Mobilitalea sp.]
MAEKVIYSEAIDPRIKLLKDHFQLKIKTFNRNEIIVNSSNDKNLMGIIVSGMAYLATINLDYQKRIIDYYEVNDMFCNSTMSNLGNNSYYIYSKSKCTVAFLDHRELLKDSTEAFVQLQDYLIINSGKRVLHHIDILSQLNLRNKLLSFFDYCRKRNNSTSFVLPITLSELAEYLAVDRSAMMREIAKMKAEAIIMSEGRKITLLE